MTNHIMKSENLIDIASFLTICGVVLYVLGWTYWSAYYSVFNIDSSFIDIPFEKILVTTWYLVILSIGAFFQSFDSIFKIEKREKLNIVTALGTIIDAIILLLAITEIITWKWYIITTILSLIPFITFALILNKLKLEQKRLSMKAFKNILLISIIISSLVCLHFFGKNRAAHFRENYYDNIELTLTENPNKQTGKLISLMGDRYFLLVKNEKETQTIIIDSNNVKQIKILKE